MAERGTRAGDREYYSVQEYDMTFLPRPLGDDPFYPTGDNAKRMNLLWDWALEHFDEGDVRVFGEDGDSPFGRWLRLEQAHIAHPDSIEDDLPGDPPTRTWQVSGLI